MRVLHVNAGAETGGGKVHIISLLSKLDKQNTDLLVFEEGMIAQEAREIGIKVYVLNQSSRFNIRVTKKLSQIIKNGNYDVVHSHGARANLFMTFVSRKKAKWVITVHSDPFLDFMGRGVMGSIYTHLNKFSLKKADHLITVSSKIRKTLIDDGIKESKITTINNGIDYDKNVYRHSEKTEQFTLTYIARFHPVKRHTYLLDALNKSTIQNYKLNLIGDGEEEGAIRQKIKSLNISDKVKLHGFLSKGEIREVLSKSDLSVLTSQSETFPLVLLESANQEVPFITTNVGDVEILDPSNSYSWIIDTDNPDELISALDEAYNEWVRGDLIEKGKDLREAVTRQFTLDEMAENVMKVYKNV